MTTDVPAVTALFAGAAPGLGDAARATARALRAALPAEVGIGALVRLPDDPTRAAGGDRAGQGGFEAGITVTGLADGDLDAVVAATGQVEGADRDASVVLVGRAHHVLPDDPAAGLLLLLAWRRLPHLTHEEAMTHWRDRHAPLVLRLMPGLRGYTQLHVTGHEIDGVASTGFVDMAEVGAVMARPEIATTALADEKTFLDHSRSHLGLYAVQRF